MRASLVGIVALGALSAVASCGSGGGGSPAGAGTGGSGVDGGAANPSAGTGGADVAGRGGRPNGGAQAGGDISGAGDDAGGSGPTDPTGLLEPHCRADGWCWENPLPAGNALRAVSGSAANDVWAVGDNGLILHFDGTAWRAVPSGVNERLTGVWAASPTQAWVSGTNNALLRWDGDKWSSAGQPAAITWASSVTGWVDKSASPAQTTVWFTDASTPIRVFDGEWMREKLPQESFTFTSAWADSTGLLWAVGSDGAFARIAGLGWEVLGTGSTARFVSVHGDADGNVWAVSEGADIVRVDARGVSSRFANDATQGLSGVHAFGPSNAWVVGAGGTLLEFDGSDWRSRPSGTELDLFAVWGASPDDVWLVGDRGTIVHCDGDSCGAPNGPITADLSAVWAASADEAWAVGTKGTIVHRTAAGWSAVESPTEVNLQAVWGRAADDVWFGGYQVLLHWDGQSLSEVPGLPNGASAIHGVAADDVWAISASSPAHWDGKTFTVSSETVSQSIFAAGPNDVWVSRFDSSTSMGHLDAAGWSKSEGEACLSLSGASATDIWCVGGINLRWVANHWDGAAWTTVATSAGADLAAVASSGANAMWYVGGSGVLGSCTLQACSGYDLNGTPEQRAFLSEDLTGVATAEGEVYAVGRRGVILRRHAK